MFNINTSNKKLLELQSINQQLSDELSSLKEENVNYKRTISTFVGVKTGYEADLEKVKALHKQELSALNTALEAEKKSLAKKFNKALADIGVNEFAAEEVSNTKTDDTKTVYDTFVGLKGAEKTEYFKKHEATLTRLLGFNKL
jgi:hypothetical protein